MMSNRFKKMFDNLEKKPETEKLSIDFIDDIGTEIALAKNGSSDQIEQDCNTSFNSINDESSFFVKPQEFILQFFITEIMVDSSDTANNFQFVDLNEATIMSAPVVISTAEYEATNFNIQSKQCAALSPLICNYDDDGLIPVSDPAHPIADHEEINPQIPLKDKDALVKDPDYNTEEEFESDDSLEQEHILLNNNDRGDGNSRERKAKEKSRKRK
ncbi:uncharacterized protein LOC126741367 [Anthonomus grandis grandis]|uniref:uncharacterized protein LOC126741367 n=1 Tax=Anthonomus grandis grandis TaxID=2921223 RepID=UPI00216530D5|nr:uncharacterized protein LOC126741367 [Anthonomus grandis grandis]